MQPKPSSWTSAELRKLKSLKSPTGVQKFLSAMPYHLANTAWSPRLVLKHNSSHCLEGAIFAAAALRALGYAPLLLDLKHRGQDWTVDSIALAIVHCPVLTPVSPDPCFSKSENYFLISIAW